MVEMIAAVSLNGSIGKNGKLPWHIPDELALFKTVTLGKTVIMGRKTWDSLNRRPLPGRKNVVISRTHVPSHVGDDDEVIFVDSLPAALEFCRDGYDAVIIGGEQVYRRFLPFVDMLHLSRIKLNVKEPDAFFPNVNWAEWDCVGQADRGEYIYNAYVRKATRERSQESWEDILAKLKAQFGDDLLDESDVAL